MFDMRFCNLILLLPCLLIVTVARAQSQPTEAEALFAHKVWPLISAKCLSCHGEDKQKGGLDLRSSKSAIQGGDGGTALISKDA